MAGVKGQKSGGNKNAGRKKLPAEEKRDIKIHFKANEAEKQLIDEEFKKLKAELKTKANVDVILYLLNEYNKAAK